MNRLEYFKLALANGLYKRRDWIVSCFSVTKPSAQSSRYFGQIVIEPWGYGFVDGNNEIVKIDDAKSGEAIYRFKDPIQVDKSFVANVQTPQDTYIGNVLFNFICILSSFGPKHAFVFGPVSVSKLEIEIAKKLQDTPKTEQDRSDNFYYVDEYLKFVDSLQFISTLSQLATISATAKGITAPTGISAFKKGLIEKYKDTLSNPVELAKYEKELLDFDEAYLKDDPANGTFLAGKIKHTARKKMFLSMGADVGFTSGLDVTPVTKSLSEGWSTDPVEFTAMMNGLRAGSFARGAETVKGGVSAKYLLRSSNNFTIQDKDCNTKLGFKRVYTDSEAQQLIGRYILDGSKTLFIEKKEDTSNYLNRVVTVRSPMYCKLEGESICKYCAGAKLSKYPTGLSIPLTEISAIILSASLKLMHTNSTSTARLDIAKSFT